MNVLDDPTVKRFLNNRELSESSIIKYERALRYYSTFIKLTPTEFIEEAENQEEDRIRMRKRKISNYFSDWKINLTEQNYKPATIQLYMTAVKTFYFYNDIEIPRIKLKSPTKHEGIEDIPNKIQIREAIKYSNPKYEAIIKLLSSSGMGISDALDLKIKDLFKALNNYLEMPVNDEFNIDDLLEIRQRITLKKELIVPTWHNLKRKKTGTIFTTFSTPECITAIIDYLKIKPAKTINDPIFRSTKYPHNKTSLRSASEYFKRLNDKCGFGYPNDQALFRTHAVGRKYFATCLYRNAIPMLSIEWMLAHKIDSTTSAYYKQDVSKLKEQYITCIPDLSIADVEVQQMETEDKTMLNQIMQILKDNNLLGELPDPKD